MPRHNRDATGADQRGFSYDISYQPDWLWRIKVTRRLTSGRQSTKVLFRNPASRPAEPPPAHVRIRLSSTKQSLEVDATIGTSEGGVRSFQIDWAAAGDPNPRRNRVTFTFVPFKSR